MIHVTHFLPQHFISPLQKIFLFSSESCFRHFCNSTSENMMDNTALLYRAVTVLICPYCKIVMYANHVGRILYEGAAAMFEVVSSCWAQIIGMHVWYAFMRFIALKKQSSYSKYTVFVFSSNAVIWSQTISMLLCHYLCLHPFCIFASLTPLTVSIYLGKD